MVAPLPSLDVLLEMDPRAFEHAMEGQSEDVRNRVRAALMERLETIDRAAWGTNRRVRGHRQRFETGKMDYHRLEQTQQWLAGQFHEAFATIYKDSAAAASSCWAYEQQFGAAQTGRVLKDAPATFGALRGWSLLGYKSPGRVAALHHAARFDFAAYRLVFSLASETGKSLMNALRETARVANA